MWPGCMGAGVHWPNLKCRLCTSAIAPHMPAVVTGGYLRPPLRAGRRHARNTHSGTMEKRVCCLHAVRAFSTLLHHGPCAPAGRLVPTPRLISRARVTQPLCQPDRNASSSAYSQARWARQALAHSMCATTNTRAHTQHAVATSSGHGQRRHVETYVSLQGALRTYVVYTGHARRGGGGCGHALVHSHTYRIIMMYIAPFPAARAAAYYCTPSSQSVSQSRTHKVRYVNAGCTKHSSTGATAAHRLTQEEHLAAAPCAGTCLVQPAGRKQCEQTQRRGETHEYK